MFPVTFWELFAAPFLIAAALILLIVIVLAISDMKGPDQ